jgi:hypothetical protein
MSDAPFGPMDRATPRGGKPPRATPAARTGMRDLLRSRTVQAVLVAACLVQGASAAARHHTHAGTGEAATSAQVLGAAGAPAPTEPGSPDATARNSLAAAAQRLADEYRGKGFHLTDELASAIVSAADSNGIAPDLAFGLVATESEFKRTARSPVGAIGLAQLMPATAALFRPGITGEDLKQPEVNLGIGFRYLGELVDRYRGDTALALTAYNRGTGTVDRILARGGDPDNGYAGKVHDPHPSD